MVGHAPGRPHRRPLLAVHGEEDTNVPMPESRQIVEAIRRRGGEARLEVFAGEGHDFTRPENRRAKADLVACFLHRHLIEATPAPRS